MIIETDILVIGGGPGGYTASFRLSDLGKKVTIVEKNGVLGGTCLNEGCIPSKTLLKISEIMEEAIELDKKGISFKNPIIDVQKILKYRDSVIRKLNNGLFGLAKQRNVSIIHGEAQFIDNHRAEILLNNGSKEEIIFNSSIIATGSSVNSIPNIPKSDRIFDSSIALNLPNISGEMLVIGGGIIGLEMSIVYRILGCKITIVELMDQLMPGSDKDVSDLLYKVLSRKSKIFRSTKVIDIKELYDGKLSVTFEDTSGKTNESIFDQILVSIGRHPNSGNIGIENIDVNIDTKGYIRTNRQMRTNIENIYAIGDVIGNPMLAHKATYEGKVVAEIICGHNKELPEPLIIPNVAYTDPEVAWVGYTENELKKRNIEYKTKTFPWIANGRATSIGKTDGFTKLIVDNSRKIIGGAIVGTNAGELISEIVLAIHSNMEIDNILDTIHPHPTLSESILMSAELIDGSITDMIPNMI